MNEQKKGKDCSMFSTKTSDIPDKKWSTYTYTHTSSGSNLHLFYHFILNYIAFIIFSLYTCTFAFKESKFNFWKN